MVLLVVGCSIVKVQLPLIYMPALKILVSWKRGQRMTFNELSLEIWSYRSITFEFLSFLKCNEI